MSGSQTSTSSQAVTAGNWTTESINGMQYEVLLPANYNPSVKYPVMLYLHQLDMGNDPSGLLSEVNPYFNSVAFRTDYPAIVVMPLLDQTADPSGETINFGGVSTADTAGEDNALAALQQVMSQYSVDMSRVYVTGNSMGGIGTEDMIIKYNAYTGTEGKIFAAALSLAGSDYGQGYPEPNQSVVEALKNVPFWAIHGGQDTTVPLAWDQNLYAAEQAIGGDMIYTQNNSLGHDVWDTYYPEDGPGTPLGWLFSQSTNGPLSSTLPNSGTTSPVTASPDNTVVMAGSTASITDATGFVWTITSGGQVAVNGVADATTAGVIELAYVNGEVWQENSSDMWWGKTSPTASWSPATGTSTSPLPATPTPTPAPTPNPTPAPTPTVTPSANDTAVKAGSSAAITDTSGNKWTITSGGQVAVNGVADATTAGVIELAYVNGEVWQENSSDMWWGKTSPTASWSPATGTSTSPLPATPTPTPAPTPNPTPAPTSTPTASPNDTVIKAGSTATITDSSGNNWTITSNDQVAVNGIADTTTANVVELAYVNGEVWQENSSEMWWGKTSPTASWSPGSGTSSSPLPATPAPTTSANATVVMGGSAAAITDASGNTWTITAGGQVAVNGTADTTTGNVAELAYVNGEVWQENASTLWWGKTSPTGSWSPADGTSTSPLAGTGGVTQSETSTTVSASQVTVDLSAGNLMVFVSGSGDTLNLSGGTNTVTDTGSGNTYVIPAGGSGSATFSSNILAGGDTLDLRTALAATNWNGSASTIASYLSVANNGSAAVLSIAPSSGGAAAAIATIDGASGTTLSGLLTHALT